MGAVFFEHYFNSTATLSVHLSYDSWFQLVNVSYWDPSRPEHQWDVEQQYLDLQLHSAVVSVWTEALLNIYHKRCT